MKLNGSNRTCNVNDENKRRFTAAILLATCGILLAAYRLADAQRTNTARVEIFGVAFVPPCPINRLDSTKTNQFSREWWMSRTNMVEKAPGKDEIGLQVLALKFSDELWGKTDTPRKVQGIGNSMIEASGNEIVSKDLNADPKLSALAVKIFASKGDPDRIFGKGSILISIDSVQSVVNQAASSAPKSGSISFGSSQPVGHAWPMVSAYVVNKQEHIVYVFQMTQYAAIRPEATLEAMVEMLAGMNRVP